METKFYRVGGSVRDSFIGGRKSKDIDYTVEADSFDVMRDAVIARGGEIFLESPQYFTIRANVPNLGAADYVLARKDGAYTDGRHPDSVQHGTLADDLARRDFTMNAIAVDENGNVIDPYDGRGDIAKRMINAVGEASQRFEEDGLRIQRAMRFSVVLGFRMSPSVFSAIDARLLQGVSLDRMREETAKMFAYDTLASMQMFETFPSVRSLVFDSMRLKPTLEK